MMDISRLRSLLKYYPDTGLFIWKESKGTVSAGMVAGSSSKSGYRFIQIDGRKYREHILAWLYMTGEMPNQQIDHINGICNDNRWCNLRYATSGQNNRNSATRKDNRSGTRGVNWHSSAKKWQCRIQYEGKRIMLGFFDSLDDAKNVYESKAKELFGEYYRGE